MSNFVKPRLPGGFRDSLPEEAIAQQEVVAIIRKVYESFGYLPLETPGMEHFETLTGGSEDFDKSIFRARIVKGIEDRGEIWEDEDTDIALRFDLTVPLARVVSQYQNIVKPFKRYQIGRVWRGEKPQKGRYREFTQFDLDIIGTRSMLADTEIILVMYTVMTSLGVKRFCIRFNNRKVLNGLAEVVGCAKQANNFFRILDKIDRSGIEEVLCELGRKPDNRFDDTALALEKNALEKVSEFLSFRDKPWEEIFINLQNFFTNQSAIGMEGVEELREVVNNLRAIKIPEESWKVDLSVARGLAYYTGPVFETVMLDVPHVGSVIGGGRYDNLTTRFSSDANMPGVGTSVGIDRLMDGLRELGLVQKKKTVAHVLVTVFNQDLEHKSLIVARNLRSEGINVELYLETGSLREQLTYAAKQEIPYVVIIGPEEDKQGMVVLKNMRTRTQTVLTVGGCADTIRNG